MNSLQAQVNALWDSYWKNFGYAEQQSRDSGESHHRVRREFAERSISCFLRLQQEFLDRIEDSTTLLFYRVGFMLYGDAGDDRSALKYLRSIVCCVALKEDLVNEQSFAVEMTLRVYEQNQEELAHTLSLISVRGISARDIKKLHRAIFAAVASRFSDPNAPINDLLYTELCRVCCLVVENDEQRTFGAFFNAYKASFG